MVITVITCLCMILIPFIRMIVTNTISFIDIVFIVIGGMTLITMFFSTCWYYDELDDDYIIHHHKK